jgi:hypothetical protein
MPAIGSCGAFTNTVFGFISAYVLLAVYQQRDTVGGSTRSTPSPSPSSWPTSRPPACWSGPTPFGLPCLAAWATPVVAVLMGILAPTVWSSAVRHHRSTGG